MELLDRADLGYFEKKLEDWDSTKTLPEDLMVFYALPWPEKEFSSTHKAHMSRNYRASLLAGLRT